MHREAGLKGLLAFVAIAEHGSINRAARALNISQPALSRTLQQLEAIIGSPLFDRAARGVTLNELGRKLLAHAQIIRAETVNAARTIEAFRRGQRRQLHIGVMTAHPLVQFAEAIIEFVQEEPNLFLRITHGSPEELMDLMRQGALEMVFGPLLSGPVATGLVQDTIYYDQVNIYCSRKNAFAHGGRVSLTDLAAAPWVLPPAGTAVRDKVSELFVDGGCVAPAPVIEVENVPMRRALVLRSDYLSAFHDHHVHHELETGQLQKVGVEWRSHIGPIGSLRLAPHTPTSLRLLGAFRSRYVAAGFQCPLETQPAVAAAPQSSDAQNNYVRH